MKSHKITYRIASILVALLLVLPILVISTHMLFHKHGKTHKHNTVTVYNKEIKLCKYDSYTFDYLKILTFLFENSFIKNNIFAEYFICSNKLYFSNLKLICKGRAPPYLGYKKVLLYN